MKRFLFPAEARVPGPQNASGLGVNLGVLDILALLKALYTLENLASTLRGFASMLPPGVPSDSLFGFGWSLTHVLMMSQKTSKGASVLIPVGLSCVEDTLYPAFAMADLTSAEGGGVHFKTLVTSCMQRERGTSGSSSSMTVMRPLTLSKIANSSFPPFLIIPSISLTHCLSWIGSVQNGPPIFIREPQCSHAVPTTGPNPGENFTPPLLFVSFLPTGWKEKA
mmetsp:Transcript_2677/g.7341  ORF Transcript_2677/g.7341 Transcript_2677/m.7341 type:complete len:223 (+) Transcript_2677:164-832(+)